ncbi:hypothetical protein CsatA_025913 [Cannabis sativa]
MAESKESTFIPLNQTDFEDESKAPPTSPSSSTSKGTANKETYFKINKKCRLFKLLQTFCNHQNVDYRDMQFLFNGKRISPKHTPHSLKMKDDDQIDAMMHTDGGGSGCDRGGNNAF